MDFGLIRSLAHHPPTPRAWDSICLALEVLGDDPACAHQRDYLLSIISRQWPLSSRCCPPRWIEQLLYRAGDWRWLTEEDVPRPPGPWLHAVSALDVMDLALPVSPGDFSRLLGSHWLSRLERVRWRAASLLDTDFDIDRQLTRLHTLELVYTGATAGIAFANAMASCDAFPSLRNLRMERFSMGDEGVAVLMRSPLFTRLRRCDLGGNGLTAGGLTSIAGDGNPAYIAHELEHLGVDGVALDPRAVLRLLQSPRFPALRSLSLPVHCIDADVASVAASRHITLTGATHSSGILVQLLAQDTREVSGFFPKEIVHIGRTQLLNDLAIPEQGISRRHCRLLHHGGELFIEDMMSARGTCINGIKRARASLGPEDIVEVGDCAFRAQLVA